MWHSIDYKREILSQPFASYDDKRTFLAQETQR
jgi:hypothetical protein